MDADDRERRLASALAEYHRRRALGENPDPEDYRSVLGEAFEEFRAVLETSSVLQDTVEPYTAPSLPQRFGRYMLTRRLGQGGMGVVFEALDEQLGRKVAVKVLRTGFDLDGTAFERFRREARACSQVQHPSIVTVHDAGAHDGRLYYTMDVVPGASLAARVKSGRMPPLTALVAGFADVADALEALHAHRPDPIIHRDVKPSNIIVDDDGRMVLADFGLARTAASESLTRTGDAIGTPSYMSPEQLPGARSEVDARSDVYGLGATIYEAIVGRPPFEGRDVAEVMAKIPGERPRSPRDATSAIPRGLEDVVLKALEKRKEDRYQTAAEMRDDLRKVAGGGRPEHGPVGRLRRGTRWAKRRAPVLALVLAALLAGAWLWTNRQGNVVFQVPGEWVVRLQDGTEVRSTDVVALSPGRYEAVVVVPAGYEKDVEVEARPFDVASGGTEPVALPVRPRTPRGDQLLLERLEASLPRIQWQVGRSRGGSRALAWPLGEVRLEDLDEWAVALGDDDLDAPLVAVFEVGDRAEEVPFTTTDVFHREPIPAKVRDGLRAGDKVRISVRKGATKVIVPPRVVRIVDRPEAAARVSAALAGLPNLDAAARGGLTARLLLQADLPGPALRAAREVRAEDRSLATWGVLATAAARVDVDAQEVVESAAAVVERARTSDPAAFDRLFATGGK